MRPPGLIASFGLLAAARSRQALARRRPSCRGRMSQGLFPCPPANAYLNEMARDQPLLLRPLLF
jgi:hypothetical protein